jgi:hypothetical protein
VCNVNLASRELATAVVADAEAGLARGGECDVKKISGLSSLYDGSNEGEEGVDVGAIIGMAAGVVAGVAAMAMVAVKVKSGRTRGANAAAVTRSTALDNSASQGIISRNPTVDDL